MRWTWAVAALLVAGCSSRSDDVGAAVGGAASTTAPPEEAQTIGANGELSTDPFDIDGGRYVVTYRLDGDCYYSARLSPVEGDLIPESLAVGRGPVEGEGNVYDVAPGSYYVEMITGPDPNCPWEITLTPA